jgi:hypothetical protein
MATPYYNAVGKCGWAASRRCWKDGQAQPFVAQTIEAAAADTDDIKPLFFIEAKQRGADDRANAPEWDGTWLLLLSEGLEKNVLADVKKQLLWQGFGALTGSAPARQIPATAAAF